MTLSISLAILLFSMTVLEEGNGKRNLQSLESEHFAQAASGINKEALETALIYYKNGCELYSQGRYLEALVCFKRSVDVHPTLAARFNLAFTLMYLGRFKRVCIAAKDGINLAKQEHNEQYQEKFSELLRAAQANLKSFRLRLRGLSKQGTC